MLQEHPKMFNRSDSDNDNGDRKTTASSQRITVPCHVIKSIPLTVFVCTKSNLTSKASGPSKVQPVLSEAIRKIAETRGDGLAPQYAPGAPRDVQ
jgi:hypothetical protein